MSIEPRDRLNSTLIRVFSIPGTEETSTHVAGHTHWYVADETFRYEVLIGTGPVCPRITLSDALRRLAAVRR